MSRDADLAAADAAIAAASPVMAGLVARWGPCGLTLRDVPGGYFATLARAILYQQLAGRAAAAIHGRFLALFGDGPPSPAAVLAMPEERLRSAGLSANKAAAIRDLARKVAEGLVDLGTLDAQPDAEIIAHLVQVRGIGQWTAEMFLMFTLGRLDVWPVDDYGVRTGYARAHGLAGLPKPRELSALGEVFRPWRSAAAWYCWRAAEDSGLVTG